MISNRTAWALGLMLALPGLLYALLATRTARVLDAITALLFLAAAAVALPPLRRLVARMLVTDALEGEALVRWLFFLAAGATGAAYLAS